MTEVDFDELARLLDEILDEHDRSKFDECISCDVEWFEKDNGHHHVTAELLRELGGLPSRE